MKNKHRLTIALAGNANVGKSSIFNQLTGLNQIVGNWPGKTVERVEGTLHFQGYDIRVLDLPGIYSLSAFTIEEIVARDYIATGRPDVVVNVVDASALERNLYFTLQLLELEKPLVMALNQVDFAAKKGIKVDSKSLSEILGIPVVPTVAVSGMGIKEMLLAVVEVAEGRVELNPLRIKYGREIEERIEKIKVAIQDALPELSKSYPSRWLAVKLLERDADIVKRVGSHKGGKDVLLLAETLSREIERIHGEASPVVIASERYGIASRIAKEVQVFVAPPKITFSEKLDSITTHGVLGYPILVAVLASMFVTIFVGGNAIVGPLEWFFETMLVPVLSGALSRVLPPLFVDMICGGVLFGVMAGITIVLPYIVPLYLILGILEDSGYLPRAAFLMDNFMHKIGLHGKAFIPLILGYGCNVPACVGCRIMETERERFLAGFLIVLIPCAARSIIILGLVGKYVGIHIALTIYLLDLILVLILGRIAFKTLPGEPVGLIMEMPPYRMPSARNVLKKTWVRTKDFVYIALPLIIVGSTLLEILRVTGIIWSLANFLSPLTSGWLGLPQICGVPLILGVFRKELTLIMLAELAGTYDFLRILTPVQMIVFSLVTMIYIPCIATMAVLAREFGWKRAMAVTLIDILLALFVGGLAFHMISAMPSIHY